MKVTNGERCSGARRCSLGGRAGRQNQQAHTHTRTHTQTAGKQQRCQSVRWRRLEHVRTIKRAVFVFPSSSCSLRTTTCCMKHHRAPFATVAQFRKPGHRVIVLCRPPTLMSHMMQSSSMGLDRFTQNDWGATKAQLCLQLFGIWRLFRDAESPDLQEASGATNNEVLEDWRTASSLLWLS